jgi:hypothetical protein
VGNTRSGLGVPGGAAAGTGTTSDQASSTSATVTGGASSGAAFAAKLAYDAGFRGEDLFKIVAIAGRESGWNPSSKNPNTSDRGMWQINWSANGSTMQKYLGAKGPEDMFNPVMNAKGAYLLWQRAGKSFFPWRASAVGKDHIAGTKDDNGWDPQGDEMYRTEPFQAQARAAATSVEKASGDPDYGNPGPRSRGNMTSHVNNSPQYIFNLSPTINFSGTPATPDLRNIAKEVASMLEQEVRNVQMRNA